jgi:beta-glucosidase
VAERHYKVLMAGVDQFGGNNDKGPVVEAYQMGIKEHGEEFMRARFEQSAVRLLTNIFRAGLFENPYLNVEETKKTVGNPDFMKAGYDAQLKSVVMLKNQAKTLPAAKEKTVYVPQRTTAPMPGFFGMTPGKTDYPVSMEIVKKYYKVTDNPAEADFALVIIDSPNSGSGYDAADAKKGGNGYLPISLQYGPYKAVFARDPSIAGGDPYEKFTNRTFKNKSITAFNAGDMKLVQETKKAMKDKPVVVAINVSKPMVFSEIEKEAGAILVTFGIQDQALLDIISGAAEPSGLLPMQMPADMKTVEEQKEDVPFDMTCYTDAEGHTYNFGFGMNWSGVIQDQRTEKYKAAR